MRDTHLFAAIVGIVSILCLSGCGGGGSSAKAPLPTPQGSSVGSVRFTVKWPSASRLIPAGAYSIRVALTVPGQTIAPQLVVRPTTGDTSTTTFNNLPVGNVTVTATAFPAADGTGIAQASGSEVVTIATNATLDAGLTLESTIQTVSITPSTPTMVVGDKLMFAVSALDGNGSLVLTGNSTWQWSNDTPTLVTIYGTGTSVNVVAMAAGSAVIHAQDTESGRSVQVTITVIASQPQIALSPASPVVAVNGAQQFTATITGLSNTAVTWSVLEGAVGGTITSDGLYTAPLTTGIYHVRATSQTLATLSAIVPVSVINSTGGGNNGGLAPSAWPKYGADAQNTGRGTGSGAMGVMKWTAALGGQISAPCSIGKDGTIYVGAWDGKLYALDGATGTQKWSFATGDKIQTSPALSVDGTIYFGSNDTNVYALDAATGKKKWTFPTGASVTSSPNIGQDGTIYIGSNDYSLYALDGVTGAKKWSFKTGGIIGECPALGMDGTVYVGSQDHNLYAFDGATGAKKWAFTTQGAVQGCVVGANGDVYLASQDGNIYAVSAANGSQQWKYGVDYGGSANSGALLTLGTDGTLLASARFIPIIFFLDGGSGTLKQAAISNGPGPSYSFAIGSDGTVYPVSAGNLPNPANITLWALSPATVQALWTYQAGQPATAGCVLGADGTLYAGFGATLIAVK